MKYYKILFAVAVIATVFCLTSCIGPTAVTMVLNREGIFKVQKATDNLDHGFSHQPYYDQMVSATDAWLADAPMEKWDITTNDGLKLIGNFYPEDSHKYVILIHGYTSNKNDMFVFCPAFAEWGYNILIPDNRAHGESEGKYIGMGWLDADDYLIWLDKIIKYDPQAQITILGVSMGGATVMMLSGLDLPSNVKCLIEDCGYTSVWDEFALKLKEWFRLPTFPFLNFASFASKQMTGYSFKEASSVERIKNAELPMLFIHGTEDSFVNYFMLDDNIEAYGGPEYDVLRVEGAGHGVSILYEPTLYLDKVKEFTDRYIK